MKKLLFLISILILFTSCENNNGEDKVFWVNLKGMYPEYVKNEGGIYINWDSILYVGQYTNNKRIFQKYQGPIKGSIVSVWSISRLKNGKPKFDEICGEEKKRPTDYSDKNYDRDWNNYLDEEEKRWDCIHELQEKAKKQTIYRYYYARSEPSHKIIYPTKTKRHSNWQVSVYNGRVGDLQRVALTSEQKKNLSSFRKHKCYKWGNEERGYDCYDLNGSKSSIYYTIRENLYKETSKEEGVLSSSWEGLKDVRYSKPQNWIEIKGIELNKEQYTYLKEVCKKGEKYCHLNNYKGKLSKEQQEYVNTVKNEGDI